jgi:hypothetical protein
MAETKTRATSGSSKTTKRKATNNRKRSTGTGDSVGNAGRSVGKAASKAKTPLLAGGAALAGALGGVALGARGARQVKGMRRPKVRIDSHDLAKAAKEVGQFGMDVGQLASELRKNREQANDVKRRSPVEVVLDGLTHRGNGS